MVEAIVPLYLAIAAGYAATRLGLFQRSEMATLSRFVITFAVPALLILALATRDPLELANPTYLSAYALGLLAMLGIGILWSRVVNGAAPVAAVLDGMGSSCPNSGFVGFPVLLATIPSVAGLALGMNMLVENLLVIPLVLALVERARSGGMSVVARTVATARSLVRSPLVWAIVIGEALAIARFELPGPLHRTVDLFAQASTATALFSVGGMLVGLRLGGRVRRMLTVVTGKLLVLPLLTWGAYLLVVLLGLPALDGDLRRALVLSAAMPTFVTYTMVAAQFEEVDVPPAVLVLGTTVSFVTLSLGLVLTASWS